MTNENINHRLDAMHKRIDDIEEMLHDKESLFGRAVGLIHEANTELLATLQELKVTKTPWWKRLIHGKQNRH